MVYNGVNEDVRTYMGRQTSSRSTVVHNTTSIVAITCTYVGDMLSSRAEIPHNGSSTLDFVFLGGRLNDFQLDNVSSMGGFLELCSGPGVGGSVLLTVYVVREEPLV